MSLKELTGRAINDWSGYDAECSCGKRHKLDTAFFSRRRSGGKHTFRNECDSPRRVRRSAREREGI